MFDGAVMGWTRWLKVGLGSNLCEDFGRVIEGCCVVLRWECGRRHGEGRMYI